MREGKGIERKGIAQKGKDGRKETERRRGEGNERR